ncbi:ATP-dependent DNA helicase PIF1-like protein [Tanacetum coccineum]
MRLTVGACPQDVREIREFAEFMLTVGDGELEEANDGEVSIDVPENILIDAIDDPVTSIIDFNYSNLLDNIYYPSCFQENAILAPTNEVVDTINDHLWNSQGRSFSKVDLYLSRPVFTHGQLYIVVLRVKSKRGLKVVVYDEDGNISKTTINAFDKEVLQGL